MKKTVLVLVLFAAFGYLFSQTTGRIAGTVKNQDGNPIAYASVSIPAINKSSQTDDKGTYLIIEVPPGRYKVIYEMKGYQTIKYTEVQVNVNEAKILNTTLIRNSIHLDSLIVINMYEWENYLRIRRKTVPWNYYNALIVDIVATPVVATPAKDDYSGGIVNEISLYQNNMRTTDLSDFRSEEYSPIKENDFFETIKDSISNFGADVDAASYINFRSYVQKNRLPVADVIRTEEMVNFFDYDYKEPTGKDPLSIHIEYGKTPWNKKSNLIHIGLKGKVLKKEQQLQNNLVFLIDVAGIRLTPNKIPLLLHSFKLMVEHLSKNDYVSIVVYTNEVRLILPPTKASEKETILQALDQLNTGAVIGLGAGIQLAYKTALENYLPQGNNRVIWATGGDLNAGISNWIDLLSYVEEKKTDGIFLTILGFGIDKYKDNLLQQLADKGDGNHFYIDNIMEAKKVLVNELTSTIYTIAKDTKIQVEFNPAQIAKHRLIGYENRMLANKDFEDDTKDAGEVGSGHTVTAIYEVIPANRDSLLKVSKTKYMESSITKEALNSDEIVTVRIRYKEPDGENSKEFSQVLKTKPLPLIKTSDNFRFSAAVVELSNILRDSAFKVDSNIDNVIQLAKSARGQDENGYRAEFINLCERVKLLLK